MRKATLLFMLMLCSLSAAWAIDAFRTHRYDAFKSMPVNHESIVFLGNSITNMQPWHEAFGADPRILNRGTGGAYSDEILANIRTVCVGEPAKIFLMVGINDLFAARTPELIVENLRRTLEEIRTVSPRTQIYVQSLLPTTLNNRVADCNALTSAMVDRFNEAHAAEANPVTYIDLYTQLLPYVNLTTPSGLNYFTDGLHLSAATYKLWIDIISPYVGLPCIYPDEIADMQYNGGFGKADAHGARASSMSVLPIAATDVLFFGDEMVSCGEWHELLGNPSVKNRGTGWQYEGADIQGITRTNKYIDATFHYAEGVEKVAPKQVLVYTGTAEVNGQTSISGVLYSYKLMVAKLRRYVGEEAKISLVSLMPSTLATAERVQEFNDGLEEYASDQENLEYIDIYSALTEEGEQRPDYFTGNMLMGCGYQVVARILAEHIEGCTPVTDAACTDYRAEIVGYLSEGWYQIQVGSGAGPKGYHEAAKGKYLCGKPHGYMRLKWGVGLTDDATDPTTCVYITPTETGNYHLQFHSSPENIYYANYRTLPSETPDEIAIIPNSTATEWRILGRGTDPWAAYDHLPMAVAGQNLSDSNADCYFRFTRIANDMVNPLNGSVKAECYDQFVAPRYAVGDVPAAAVLYINDEGQCVSYATGEVVPMDYYRDVVPATAVPVDFNPAGKGFATLYSPVALTLPEGVQAFVGGAVKENGNLEMHEITEKIPPFTGVVLLGTAGETHQFMISPKEKEEGPAPELTEPEPEPTPTSSLKGTVMTIPAEEGSYVFSVVGEAGGFYKFAGATLRGFRAYYVPEVPADNTKSFTLHFGGNTVAGCSKPAAIGAEAMPAFDFQGRRADASYRGIVLQGGRKILRF